MGEFEPGWLLRDARRASNQLEQWRLRQMTEGPTAEERALEFFSHSAKYENVDCLAQAIREAEQAAIDRCIEVVKSRKPYDQEMVRELEKLREG